MEDFCLQPCAAEIINLQKQTARPPGKTKTLNSYPTGTVHSADGCQFSLHFPAKTFQTSVGHDFPAMIQWSWCLWANTGFPVQNDGGNHSYVWAWGLHSATDSVSLNNIMLTSQCVWHYQLPTLNILFKVEQLVDDWIICLIRSC